MEDTNFTASTESAAPTDSGVVDTSTTSASGSSAGEQVAAPQTFVSANAPEPSEHQIEAGWSFDGETATENAFPDDDSDIEQMMGDPALDPARTPGLVESLRNLRAQYRDLHKQHAAMSQRAGDFALYGGVDGALELLKGYDQLALNPQEGAFSFLSNLASNAYPAYTAIADTLLEHQPEYFLEKLQASGHLPAQTYQNASDIDADILASVPAHLQDTYKRQPAEARTELDLMSETARNHFLEREAKLDQLDAIQRQQAEQAWQGQVQQARAAGQQSIESLGRQYEQAHYQQLAKWSPFGAENDADNQALYGDIVNGALNDLLNDPKFAQMYVDANKMLSEAPYRRLMNEGLAAGQDEIKARQLATQFNARLGQVLKARVEKLDSVFRDARAYRAQQQQSAPQRTEIKGTSAQPTSSGIGVNALKSNGQVDPAYLDRLARTYGLGS